VADFRFIVAFGSAGNPSWVVSNLENQAVPYWEIPHSDESEASPTRQKHAFYLSETGAFEVSFAGPRFALILDQGIPECDTEQ
jgi:hypothetical protein